MKTAERHPSGRQRWQLQPYRARHGLHGFRTVSGGDNGSIGNYDQLQVISFDHTRDSQASVPDYRAPSAAPEPSQVGMLALVGIGLGGLMLRARGRSVVTV